MASPRPDPGPPRRPPDPATLATPATPAPTVPAVPGEPVVITLKSERVTHEPTAPVTTAAPLPPTRSDDTCYVRNSSFLSRDIEAKKSREVPLACNDSQPGRIARFPGPPSRQGSTSSASGREPPSPPRRADPPPVKSPPIKSPPPVNSPPVKPPPAQELAIPPASKVTSPPSKKTSLPRKDVKSPPAPENKSVTEAPKGDDTSNSPRTPWRESPVAKEGPVRVEKLSLAATEIERPAESEAAKVDGENVGNKVENNGDQPLKSEESHGVGDKIKKFERAAEDATVTTGRLSRPGSVRGRPRTERLGSDNSQELAPPATPFKGNVHFELSAAAPAERPPTVLERQQSLTRSAAPARWQRTETMTDSEKVRPEPQKIIKPEFKPMPSSVDVTIRSPSLGNKIPDQFPSHGTAFRNVASPDPSRAREQKANDDVNTQNNFKTCKLKTKDKYSVSKGSSYFTRGSEEIWLVKKKDIEEIEERVLDSFRRAGGNMCMRSESMRPSSDSGQGASFSHATMGRGKRQMYARSESLDPQWAGTRAHTLKRQTSVACTCGHDKKTRAKSADTTPRPRSRSHGDDNNQQHVLDKYETLV